MSKATGHVLGSLPKNELSLHMFPKLIFVKSRYTYFPEHLLNGYIYTISTKSAFKNYYLKKL